MGRSVLAVCCVHDAFCTGSLGRARAQELVSKNSGKKLFVSCRSSSIALGENFMLCPGEGRGS